MYNPTAKETKDILRSVGILDQSKPHTQETPLTGVFNINQTAFLYEDIESAIQLALGEMKSIGIQGLPL